MGAYFSELEVIFTCPVPGSDPILSLQSMENLQELKPEMVFFSHGCATRDAAKIIKSSIDQALQCLEAAFEALKAGEDKKEIARRITEIIAGGSNKVISDFSDWPYLIPMTVGGYQQYFKKNNMI